MINPEKENAMLLNIQYIKARKKENLPDYLYIIWKNLDTGEKHLNVIKEPLMDIYFEKPEHRNHEHNLDYQEIDKLNKVTVKSKDIIYAIVEDAGESAKNFLKNCFETKDYNKLKTIQLYPYVFGSDYDVASWYRIQWLRTLNNDRSKKLDKGFMDIEVDGFEVAGMPDPITCPINAITLFNEVNKECYTFLYLYRPCIEKDTTHMTSEQKQKELYRREMYKNMHRMQKELEDNPNELISELHELFDDSYGSDITYKLYFYNDEKKMLVHYFQMINMLKLDIIDIWNLSFDIPYISDRASSLGLDPTNLMSHPDFPVKQCYFKEDKINHDIKNKWDTFFLTSYTYFQDQMELYASIRKGASELRSFKLNYIAQRELKDSKLDYSDDGDIKTLPYTNFKKFVIYNIKDVLLQVGIERRTSDLDTFYVTSYENATDYSKVFRQTVKLRNTQYLSFLEQGLIPGNNINIFNSEKENQITDDEDDDESEFEGALVADPIYNDYVGQMMYGRKTNNVFSNAIDLDMGAFYPNSIFAMNIAASTLIFKIEMPISQYNIFDGKLKFRGITGDKFEKSDDAAKECLDNFQTGNYLTMGHKWLNLPDVYQVYKYLNERL